MDQLTIEQLDGLLDLLQEKSVEEFEGLGIHVKFAPGSAPTTDEGYEERPKRIGAANPWTDPSLWPGGKPPEFHKKEQK
jgi:hypothetical protein